MLRGLYLLIKNNIYCNPSTVLESGNIDVKNILPILLGILRKKKRMLCSESWRERDSKESEGT